MQKDSVERLIAAFADRTLLVIGDVMIDEYVCGRVRRICPEAPVPVVEEHERSQGPGGAANVAANAASLGGRVLIAGVIGADAAGERLRRVMKRWSIDQSGLLEEKGRATTTKTHIVANHQQMLRIDSEDRRTISPGIEQRILRWAQARIGDADLCVLSDYAKGVLTPSLTAEIIELAALNGCPVLVDPKKTDLRTYLGATVITPNLDEARAAAGALESHNNDILAIGARLLELLPGTNVMITRGPDGIALFRKDSNSLCIPSRARQVYDVTGAGDTALAALALAIASGACLEDAAFLANTAGGVVVEKFGTATLSPEELSSALRSDRVSDRSVAVPA